MINNLEEFFEKIPFLYHLTSRENFQSILNSGLIYSTNEIIEMSGLANANDLMTTRRPGHLEIPVGDQILYIRDQKPLNRALDKCLTDGECTREQYIKLLNSRVFTWPNLKRLGIHFGRYENENPVIFRFDSRSAIAANPHLEVTHLNSGATRPTNGTAAARGLNTFASPANFRRKARDIAEVTFPGNFVLPENYFFAEHPDGPWRSQL